MTHTPGVGVVWGSGLGSCVGLRPHALLPTKTSRLCSQSFGRARVFSRTPSQVDLTLCMEALSCLITVAVILSLVSLLLMLSRHLFVISVVSWFLPWITRSHLSTHIRWADSVRRIWSSRAALALVCVLWLSWSYLLFQTCLGFAHLGGCSFRCCCIQE